jgi:hypothetical protein
MRTRAANPTALINIDMRTKPFRLNHSLAFVLYQQGVGPNEIIRQICHPAKSFRLFFHRAKVEFLFNQIIRTYGGGVYFPAGPVDRNGWQDLLGNAVNAPRGWQDMLNRGRANYSPEQIKTKENAIKAMVLELKVVEDWIFFHRESVLKALSV